MIYVTTTFWLLAVVLLAGGVHHIWCGIVKPKTVNTALLPGTMIAQLGRTVGLLLTGATYSRGGKAGQDGGPVAQPKSPVVGPVVVGLLPMMALGMVMYLAVSKLGMPVLARLPGDQLATELPNTMPAFWDQLVGLIRLAEGSLNAIRDAEIVKWQLVLFIYLTICLTVRLGPLYGNLRGHIGAVLVMGVFAWLAGSVVTSLPDMIRSAWPILALAVGCLILLLMMTLVIRAAVTTTKAVLKLD